MALPATLTKRCERCGQLFQIPNMRISPARELTIEFFPCSHCHFSKDVTNPKTNRTGRCIGCSIPFAIIDHHANGRCKRCQMRELRKATPQTAEELQ